ARKSGLWASVVRELVLHNIMAPYRFPLFRALSRQPNIDLTVWFMSESARNRRWRVDSSGELGFNYAVLPRLEVGYSGKDLFTYIINYGFPIRFARQPFDVVVSEGWLDFASQAAFLLSKVLRRKFIIWSESTLHETSWRRSLAQPLVRSIVRGSDACIAVGTRSREYLQSLGAKHGDIFTAYSTVDVEMFQRSSQAARGDRDRWKSDLGISGKRVIMYCVRFIERKGLPYLIDAFARVRERDADVALVLVGYGPLRDALFAQAASRGLTDIHVVGHVEVESMPGLYAMADVFVLP